MYDVLVHFAGGVERGGVLTCAGDSYYRGDVIFLITNVPKCSKSKQYELATDDVLRWLINGPIDGIESVQMQIAKVANLQQTLQQLETDVNTMIKAEPLWAHH